jgi:hypothetical protein
MGLCTSINSTWTSLLARDITLIVPRLVYEREKREAESGGRGSSIGRAEQTQNVPCLSTI